MVIYDPFIRAEDEIQAQGIKTVVAGLGGLPDGVNIPAIRCVDDIDVRQ